MRQLSDYSRYLVLHGHKIVTAESCTGGGVAYAITSLPGSSKWFDRAFVTYSNAAKQQMLGVSSATLEQYGAVSEQTAIEMAQSALGLSEADISLSITGIAGPDVGTQDKPIGTVCFAWASDHFATTSIQQQFSGDRRDIRQQAIAFSLHKMMALIQS